MNNNISAVMFDYGGVLELSDSDLTSEIVQTLGITKEEWGNVYYAHNHLSNVGHKERKEILLLVAEKIGATEAQLAAIADLADKESRGKRLNNELVEIIRKLRARGLKTAIISNYTSILRQRIIDQGIDNAFDAIIISSEEGYQKPDPRIFEAAYQKLGVTAAETVFVDDSQSSLRTATEIGYTPILYTDNASLEKRLSELLNYLF